MTAWIQFRVMIKPLPYTKIIQIFVLVEGFTSLNGFKPGCTSCPVSSMGCCGVLAQTRSSSESMWKNNLSPEEESCQLQAQSMTRWVFSHLLYCQQRFWCNNCAKKNWHGMITFLNSLQKDGKLGYKTCINCLNSVWLDAKNQLTLELQL